MAIITRAGVQALTPEQVLKNRHPQSGRFIRKGSSPVRKSGSRPAGSIPARPKENR